MGGHRRTSAMGVLSPAPRSISSICANSFPHAMTHSSDGTDPGHARPPHALGSRVVPAVRGVPRPAGPHDGRPHRATRFGLPPLPPGGPDGPDPRLPEAPAGSG